MKTGAAVGQQFQRLQSRLDADGRLRVHVAEIEQTLSGEKTR
jgi:hypothetical protein